MAQTNQPGDKQLNVLAQPWFPGMTMARQRVTVYDLYGLLGVSPNVDEDGLRAAYDAITEKLQQVPSDVINAAYSVLTNPFKRAQYDRDRLEYLYKQFSDHEAFPPTTSVPSANIKGRDDQIQVYTATLVERVKDPTAEKKRAINRRIETIRNELDEFHEKSGRQRQDWATSNNRVLRMAGNALCEVVVCAEEDLRMLEDELGRIDGKLSPRDPEGPAGRVTSTGCYGSEIMAMPTGTMTDTLTGTMHVTKPTLGDSQPRVLMNKETPRIPRSPTVRFLPQSASKLGIDGTAEYTPSSEGSQEAREAQGNNRVNDFLLDKADRRVQVCRWPNVSSNNNNLTIRNAAQPMAQQKQQPAHDGGGLTLLEKLRQSAGLERVGADHQDNNNNNGQPAADKGAMGLVAWQRFNGPGPGTPDQQKSSPAETATKRSHSQPPSDLSAYDKPYDPTHTNSADQPQPSLRPAQQQEAWGRSSWDPAYHHTTRGPGLGVVVAGDGDHYRYGGGYGPGPGPYAAARPATHAHGLLSATATNTVLFKEVQDRAAALARAPGRWVVGGQGLTNYGGAGAGRGGGSAEKEKRAQDPFA